MSLFQVEAMLKTNNLTSLRSLYKRGKRKKKRKLTLTTHWKLPICARINIHVEKGLTRRFLSGKPRA